MTLSGIAAPFGIPHLFWNLYSNPVWRPIKTRPTNLNRQKDCKIGAGDAVPETEVRYLSITNPFATNRSLDYSINRSVRLACLSHAASVHSEPGSNPSDLIRKKSSEDVFFWRLNTSVYAPKVLIIKKIINFKHAGLSVFKTGSYTFAAFVLNC